MAEAPGCRTAAAADRPAAARGPVGAPGGSAAVVRTRRGDSGCSCYEETVFVTARENKSENARNEKPEPKEKRRAYLTLKFSAHYRVREGRHRT